MHYDILCCWFGLLLLLSNFTIRKRFWNFSKIKVTSRFLASAEHKMATWNSFQQLENVLHMLHSKRLTFFIRGDINIKVLDADCSETKLLKLAVIVWMKMFNKLTYVTVTTRTAIDNVVTNCDCVTLTVIRIATSDHIVGMAPLDSFVSQLYPSCRKYWWRIFFP